MCCWTASRGSRAQRRKQCTKTQRCDNVTLVAVIVAIDLQSNFLYHHTLY